MGKRKIQPTANEPMNKKRKFRQMPGVGPSIATRFAQLFPDTPGFTVEDVLTRFPSADAFFSAADTAKIPLKSIKKRVCTLYEKMLNAQDVIIAEAKVDDLAQPTPAMESQLNDPMGVAPKLLGESAKAQREPPQAQQIVTAPQLNAEVEFQEVQKALVQPIAPDRPLQTAPDFVRDQILTQQQNRYHELNTAQDMLQAASNPTLPAAALTQNDARAVREAEPAVKENTFEPNRVVADLTAVDAQQQLGDTNNVSGGNKYDAAALKALGVNTLSFEQQVHGIIQSSEFLSSVRNLAYRCGFGKAFNRVLFEKGLAEYIRNGVLMKAVKMTGSGAVLGVTGGPILSKLGVMSKVSGAAGAASAAFHNTHAGYAAAAMAQAGRTVLSAAGTAVTSAVNASIAPVLWTMAKEVAVMAALVLAATGVVAVGVNALGLMSDEESAKLGNVVRTVAGYFTSATEVFKDTPESTSQVPQQFLNPFLDTDEYSYGQELKPYLPDATGIDVELYPGEVEEKKETFALFDGYKPTNWPLGNVDNKLFLDNLITMGIRYTEPLNVMPETNIGGVLRGEGVVPFAQDFPPPIDLDAVVNDCTMINSLNLNWMDADLMNDIVVQEATEEFANLFNLNDPMFVYNPKAMGVEVPEEPIPELFNPLFSEPMIDDLWRGGSGYLRVTEPAPAPAFHRTTQPGYAPVHFPQDMSMSSQLRNYTASIPTLYGF